MLRAAQLLVPFHPPCSDCLFSRVTALAVPSREQFRTWVLRDYNTARESTRLQAWGQQAQWQLCLTNLQCFVQLQVSCVYYLTWVSLLTVWQETQSKYTCMQPSSQLSHWEMTPFLAKKCHKMTPLSRSDFSVCMCKNHAAQGTVGYSNLLLINREVNFIFSSFPVSFLDKFCFFKEKNLCLKFIIFIIIKCDLRSWLSKFVRSELQDIFCFYWASF